ncbi:nitrilase [Pilobolus umbonatus]|nr:nitrilase [Pilobolus umbonatus]
MNIAAVGQFCATSAISNNKRICRDMITKAANLGAKMIFLPEASDFISRNREETLSLTSCLDTSDFVLSMQEKAREESIWVSVGVHETCTESINHVYNTHIVINEQGSIMETYRKLHLFNVDIENGPRLMESDSTKEGTSIVSPVATPLGVLGLQTCYDMRFPELSLLLRRRGAELLAFPSAFTIKTGMAHWETLLRARAIENQSYVIASAQIGQHNEKRASYGNAMIVDPWGTVLAKCPDTMESSLAVAPIDLGYLRKIRLEMPVLEHRRNDLYPAIQ